MHFSVLLAVTLGLVAFTVGDEKIKLCVKAKETCGSAKELFKDLRDMEIVDPKVDIPKYLDQLHELWNTITKDDCHAEFCTCNNGELNCAKTKENIREILLKVELPECLQESETAKTLFTNLKKAIEDKNRADVLANLKELGTATRAAVAKPNNEKMVGCIADTIKRIRGAIQNNSNKFDMQKSCNFCTK